MIASNNVSESDLFFLIPNNIKKMHGFPPTRTIQKKKRKYKDNKKHHILSFQLFDLIEEIIEETLPPVMLKGFDNFVEIKNIPNTEIKQYYCHKCGAIDKGDLFMDKL